MIPSASAPPGARPTPRRTAFRFHYRLFRYLGVYSCLFVCSICTYVPILMYVRLVSSSGYDPWVGNDDG
jgi:hypothetical protein